MKHFLLALILSLLAPAGALAQCNGVFGPNTICGTVAGGIPGQVSNSVLTGAPGGTNGQIEYNSSGVFGGFTANGDATINTGTGAVSVTKTGGVAFATSATTDTTSATNISTGTLSASRLPTSVLGNVLNAQSANYSIIAGDNGKTIYATGGPFTITLPGVGGFASDASVTVCNGDVNDVTHHAVKLSGFPIPVFSRLYMQQCVTVVIENGTWQAKTVPGRFRPNFGVQLFVDTGGSSTNDGFVSNAAANAINSIQNAYNILANEYDLLGGQPFISVTAGQNGGPLSAIGQLVNSAVINIQGNAGQGQSIATATTGTAALFLGDFAPYVISASMTWDCTGAAANCTSVSLHQQGGTDLNSGTILKGGASTHVGLLCDSMCKVNANAALTLSGTLNQGIVGNLGSMFNLGGGVTVANNTTISGGVFVMNTGSQLSLSGALTAGTTVSANEIFTVRSGATVCLTGFTTSGTFTGARQWSVLNNSFFANVSANAVPGSAGINTAATFAAGVLANSGLNSGGC